jgi:hypothetical protein
MKNSNRRFYNNKCEIFESLSQKEVQQLCISEVTFTNLTGFLFLRKANIANNKLKVSRQMLIDSMKESLYLSQN